MKARGKWHGSIAFPVALLWQDDAFRQQSEMAISRADSRPRLCRIDVPTLTLCGADDRLCNFETCNDRPARRLGWRVP